MKIAVINEVSTADKNAAILSALRNRGHDIVNVGMCSPGDTPSLNYLQTGFLAGLLINTGAVDYVVGGCGTGQGFQLSCMMYPRVICGLINEPLDGWLFTQINGGNCISLALNKGYGWGSEAKLMHIFDRLFEPAWGCGYPVERRIPQTESRKKLDAISSLTHKSMADIIDSLDPVFVRELLLLPRIKELIAGSSCPDLQLMNKINSLQLQ